MPTEEIKELLNKQKLVEGVVHSQGAPHQEIVDTLIHKQHLAKLESMVVGLPAEEVGNILEAMPIEDAKKLWEKVPEERKNDILWEVTDATRKELAGGREPGFSDSQMYAFELANGQLRQVAIVGRQDLKDIRPIWIDLLNASKTQRAYIGEHFGLELPDPGDVADLEVSTRFHIRENNEIHLHSNFLLDRAGESRSVPVAFILHDGILFSLRNEELPIFRLQRRRASVRPGYVSDSYDLLLDLYGADVEYSADSLECIYKNLSKVGKLVLSESMSDKEAAAVLADIAEEEDLNGQIRSNILDTQRALAFLMQAKVLSQSQTNDVRQILRNIESLNSHTSFLFDKINFLMDATIGFININQNRRVSQLTSFGVVFMPINILAGIGGMSEFSMMTHGIPWPVAYGLFLVGMVMLGWGVYIALKQFEKKKVKKIVKGQSAIGANRA